MSQKVNSKIHIIVYTSLSIIALASCHRQTGNADSEKPTIAVSIEPQRHLVEAISGNDFDIVTVLDRGANPETFEPSMSKRLAVDNSIAYLTIGAFPFEDVLINSSNQDLKAINTAEGITPVYGTHEHSGSDHHHHADHGDADPHVWTSTKNAKIIASNIAKTAAKINPDKAELYNSRLDSLCGLIDSIDNRIATKLADAPSKSFVIWHPSLSYLARDFGLKQIAVGQESKEISPKQLREIIDRAVDDSVRVFFFQKEFDSRQARTISQRIGTRLVPIDPLAYDWISQLNAIADELSRH